MGLILILEPSNIRLLPLGRDIITVYRENQQYRGRYYEWHKYYCSSIFGHHSNLTILQNYFNLVKYSLKIDNNYLE